MFKLHNGQPGNGSMLQGAILCVDPEQGCGLRSLETCLSKGRRANPCASIDNRVQNMASQR